MPFDLTATARSLLNIEINTIIRDNITGEPMPPVPHALLDIARDYADTLCGLLVDLPAWFTPEQAGRDPATLALAWSETAGTVSAVLTVSSDTFDRLRWAALRLAAAKGAPAARMTAAQRSLLDRIVNNCDAIKEMFKRFDHSMDRFIGLTRADLIKSSIEPNSYNMSPDDLIVLQKVWDIGVAEIIAQTVVHVTGDVTTRLAEAFREPGAQSLFAIHRQSVDVSVACWQHLLDAVNEIAGAAVRVLLAGKV